MADKMQYSDDQQQAHDQILEFMRDKSRQEFVVAGYAGVGKSFLASRIAEEIGSAKTMFCAYTGKAANVLRERGCENASTLHGALYNPVDDDGKWKDELQSELFAAEAAGDERAAKIAQKRLDQRTKEAGQPLFALAAESPLEHAKLVVVDEYSMLDSHIISDLRKKAKKILYLGDPFQLPPVKGECPLVPDAWIRQIHRQAMDSAIIRASLAVREGASAAQLDDGEDFRIKKVAECDPLLFLEADQLIVGRNDTRKAWNARFRERKGYTSPIPEAGEKLICLKNNNEKGLFNGMIGEALEDAKYIRGDLFSLDFDGVGKFRVWEGDCIETDAEFDWKIHEGVDRFTYAYAITCHKSQGSEFDNLVVLNEPVGGSKEMRQRWLYTAITRAKRDCTLVLPAAAAGGRR